MKIDKLKGEVFEFLSESSCLDITDIEPDDVNKIFRFMIFENTS